MLTEDYDSVGVGGIILTLISVFRVCGVGCFVHVKKENQSDDPIICFGKIDACTATVEPRRRRLVREVRRRRPRLHRRAAAAAAAPAARAMEAPRTLPRASSRPRP